MVKVNTPALPRTFPTWLLRKHNARIRLWGFIDSWVWAQVLEAANKCKFKQQFPQKPARRSTEGSICALCNSGSREYGPGEKRGPGELIDFSRITSFKLKKVPSWCAGDQEKAVGGLHGWIESSWLNSN